MIFLSGDGDYCWVEKLEALLGVGLGPRISRKARKISRVEMARHFKANVPISWRLIAFMNHPYLIQPEISWSSGSLWPPIVDEPNRQVCSGSVPFRFSKFKMGWTNYLLQHMRQHAVLVFLGASLPWCGMGWFWPNESSTNRKEEHNIRICFFLQVHPPIVYV